MLLSGCKADRPIALNNHELQTLINNNYLAPQIRSFELLPLVNAQVYLNTPELHIEGDSEPLSFSFSGHIDADLFGNAITGQIPLRVTGVADLHYDSDDQTFYFAGLQLKDALIDLELSMIQALMMDQFRKKLSEELVNLPIISLKQGSALASKLGNKRYQVDVQKSLLTMTPEER